MGPWTPITRLSLRSMKHQRDLPSRFFSAPMSTVLSPVRLEGIFSTPPLVVVLAVPNQPMAQRVSFNWIIPSVVTIGTTV